VKWNVKKLTVQLIVQVVVQKKKSSEFLQKKVESTGKSRVTRKVLLARINGFDFLSNFFKFFETIC
jgi:hypothetical protein